MEAVLLPFDIKLAPSESLSQSIYQRGDTFWRTADVSESVWAFDSLFNRTIPGVVDNQQGGWVVANYTDIFYNGIYLIPNLIEFGAVVSDISRSFYLWNAYLNPVDLQEVTIQGGDGLVLNLTVPVPSQFKALQFAEMSLLATPNGPPTIDAKFDFVFDIRTYRLSATGMRAELWDIRPNWEGGYRISYEYKTEIITSRSGKEQRRALRQTPRKSLEYEVIESHHKAARLRAVLDGWQDKNYIAPEITRSVVTTSGLGVGNTDVNVELVPHWLRDGAIVVLSHGKRNSVRIVSHVTGNTVTFTAAGESAWPEGSTVHPGLLGRVGTSQRVDFVTSQVARMGFRFDVVPGSEGSQNLGTSYPTFNGAELFMKQGNWAQPVNVTFQADVETLDYGRGVVEYLPLLDHGRRITQVTFLSRSRDEAEQIESFFHRNKGRRRSFYMPTWMPDMVVVKDLSNLNRFMTVAGEDIYRFYRNDPVFQHILIRFVDGSEMIRTIVDMGIENGNTVLDTVDNWPRDITPSEILMVSWLVKVRLASDILTIDWRTDRVAQFQMSVQSVEDDQ